ncbi:MAG TPA: hypothetical protein VGF25_17390 [Thermoleophilaceae bacterium]
MGVERVPDDVGVGVDQSLEPGVAGRADDLVLAALGHPGQPRGGLAGEQVARNP